MINELKAPAIEKAELTETPPKLPGKLLQRPIKLILKAGYAGYCKLLGGVFESYHPRRTRLQGSAYGLITDRASTAL